MIVLNLQQGSPEWEAVRRRYFTASEAPAMMGASKKVTRNELLRMKATGSEREFSEWVRVNLLDKGHEIEAAARPIAEAIIGEDLYPITATDDDDYLLASFDGITMGHDVCWECKSWNEARVADVREGRCPEEDVWQVIQQLVVSGAEKCLYMVSDGTEERTVYCWVTLQPGDITSLMAGWKQFETERDEYTPREPVAEAVGRAPDALPALRIEITGQVTNSNLEAYRKAAMAVFAGINRNLTTDQDFADAERTVKWCADVEGRLAAAKSHALSQTASIDELFVTIDGISAEARRVRLDLERLVKARKEQIRAEIVTEGKAALAAHVAALDKRLGGGYMPEVHADFAAAIKGKRTIDSLRNAVDTLLAKAKIETSARADAIDANLKAVAELTDDMSLVPDLRVLALKSAEDFRTTIKLRIAEREAREKAELERIRAEERAKAEREAREAEEKRQAALRASEEAERRQQREADEARRREEEANLEAQRRELAQKEADLAAQAQATAKPAQRGTVTKPAPAPTLSLFEAASALIDAIDLQEVEIPASIAGELADLRKAVSNAELEAA